ncbi:MAG TPA: hypothetical protein VEI51_06665, partial [Methanomicrobiales archaeon]|nr:hypothetical protein [Methanomicrobiales archaeon]
MHRRPSVLLACALVLFLGVAASPAAAITGADWYRATASAGFLPRYGHSSLVFDNGTGSAIWVTGGDDATFTHFGDTWNSPDGFSWRLATTTSPRRSAHSAVVFGGKMWVIGGMDQTQIPVNDVWNSSNGIIWARATPGAGFANRSSQGSVVFGGKMWVIGGEDTTSATVFNDVWSSANGIAWTQESGATEFGARAAQATVAFDNQSGGNGIWLIGGYDDTGTLYDDVWFSADGATWTLENASAGFDPRSGLTAAVYNNRLWVFGGTDGAGTVYNDVWYSDNGVTWTKATDHAGFSARYGESSVVFGNALWAIGGYDLANAYNDTWYTNVPAAPTVTGVAPATGINTGLVTITALSGTGFNPQPMVNLTRTGQANVTATNVTVVSPTKLTCTINLNGTLPGSWDVTVTNPGGGSATLPSGFAVTAPAPTVGSITPTSGYNTGLISISSIGGTGFASGATVKIVNVTAGLQVAATNVTVNPSGKSIACTFNLVGAQAGKWNVTVTNPDTQSGTLVDGFTVFPRYPTVTNVIPNSSENSGEVAVTLTGSLFANGATVRLEKAGETPIDATNVSVNSETNITCSFDLKAVADGSWTLDVINPGNQGNNIFQFIVIAAKAIVNQPSSPPASASVGSSGGFQASNAPVVWNNPARPASPAPPETGVTGDLHISAEGVTTHETVIQSEDSLASVTIPQGIVAKDEKGAPLASVSIKGLAASDVPADNPGSTFSFAGRAYELGPNGATFSPSFTLSFAVADAHAAGTYTIRTVDRATGLWTDLPTTYHPETGTVTAEVSHFCCFALFLQAAPAPAATAAATPVPTTAAPKKAAAPSTAMAIFSGLALWTMDKAVRYPFVVAGAFVIVVAIAWVGRRQLL